MCSNRQNTGIPSIQIVKTGIATFSFMGIYFSFFFFWVQIKQGIYYQQEIQRKTYIKANLKIMKQKRKKPL